MITASSDYYDESTYSPSGILATSYTSSISTYTLALAASETSHSLSDLSFTVSVTIYRVSTPDIYGHPIVPLNGSAYYDSYSSYYSHFRLYVTSLVMIGRPPPDTLHASTDINLVPYSYGQSTTT